MGVWGQKELRGGWWREGGVEKLGEEDVEGGTRGQHPSSILDQDSILPLETSILLPGRGG